MSYCTLADLQDRFGEDEILQLSDHAGAGTLDTTTIAKAIADADAEIDGYLAGRYTLPLSIIPANLTRIACDVARYLLYENAATQIVIDRYDAAIKYLELVAKGSIGLGPDVDGIAPEITSGIAMIESDGTAFAAGVNVW